MPPLPISKNVLTYHPYQSCSPMRLARPLGKLIRLARSASPPRPRCCISCSCSPTIPGNPSRVPDSMLEVAARLAYSGPRVCDGSRLKVGRDASSVPCDPLPLLVGEARELLATLMLLSLPLPLPAGLALLPLPGGGGAVVDVVGGGGPVDVVLPRRRGGARWSVSGARCASTACS